MDLSSLPSSIPDMRFSLIRLCFVSSQCTLHRASLGSNEKLETSFFEYFPRIRCETLAATLTEPFGPSIESAVNKPIHFEEDLPGIATLAKIIVSLQGVGKLL
jgi:hypothetical protein